MRTGGVITLTLELVFLAMILPSVAANGVGGAQFYVATGGNDAWSGRLAEPNADGTDGQIDQLVYELYGLTDEEIRIVEEATER